MQAIILCGGKGQRLGHLTSSNPKGMLEVNGVPFLQYQLNWLKKFGVKDIIFACGYLYEEIKNYFGKEKDSLKISYSVENKPLGRAGAVKAAWKMLKPSRNFLVLNGDVYTEMNLKDAITFHENQNNCMATISIFPYNSPYGVVKFNELNQIEQFEEKPLLPHWINGGIYVFEYNLENYFPESGDLEDTVFPALAKEKLLYSYKSKEYWKSIETIKDLNELSAYILNNNKILNAV